MIFDWQWHSWCVMALEQNTIMCMPGFVSYSKSSLSVLTYCAFFFACTVCNDCFFFFSSSWWWWWWYYDCKPVECSEYPYMWMRKAQSCSRDSSKIRLKQGDIWKKASSTLSLLSVLDNCCVEKGFNWAIHACKLQVWQFLSGPEFNFTTARIQRCYVQQVYILTRTVDTVWKGIKLLIIHVLPMWTLSLTTYQSKVEFSLCMCCIID